jgi:hypothetical protein
VTSPIFKCNVDFKVYSLVLKVLNKSVVYREPMPLLSFKRGIKVIYIIWLKWGSSHLAEVRNYIAWLDSYRCVRPLYLRA